MRYLHSLKLKRGHTVFEFELATKLIRVASIENYDLKGGQRKRIVIKDGHLYTSALNAKNADKKFIKMVYKLLEK